MLPILGVLLHLCLYLLTQNDHTYVTVAITPLNFTTSKQTITPGMIFSISRNDNWICSRLFSGMFECWNFRSQDYSFPVHKMELFFSKPFVPWNFHSRYPGPFLPQTIHSFVSRAVPGPLTKKEQRNKQKRRQRPCTAAIHKW